MTTPPLAHTPESAAATLNLSRATVYDLMRRGLLPSFKVGRSRRIAHTVLVAFVDRAAAEGRVD
ncbi:MAG: helix-turn-helix domain-containing protein [Candidatus Nanopelagicales bacterium]